MENTPNKRKISPTVQHPAARWAFVLVLCAALGVVVSYYWRVFYGLDARGLAPLAVTGCCVGLAVLAGAAALDLPRLAALPDARTGRAWKGLVWCTLALSTASQVENLLRMKGAWPAAPVGKAAGRKLALELLSLAFVVCGGVYLARRLKAPAAGGDAQGAEKKLERYGREKGLTRREQEVLALVLRGEDGPRIARELYISPGTVKVHVHNILQKAGCRSRAELCRAVDETEP